MIQLMEGDCLERMKEIPDHSVDMILCDLPYGVTDCSWDSIIPFSDLWENYRRVLKPYGSVVLFGTEPFMHKIISSNYSAYSHQWYWKKNKKTGGLIAHKQPMRCIEEIAVFTENVPFKNNKGKFNSVRKYLIEEKKKSGLKRKQIDELLGNQMSSHYFTKGMRFSLPSEKDYKLLQTTGFFNRDYEDLKKEMEEENGAALNKCNPIYNPQGVFKLEKPRLKNEKGNYGEVYANVTPKIHKQLLSGFPCNFLEFNTESKRYHPTQKPVDLLRYLVRTYTNRGGVVMDNCMGSGSTGVACVIEGRSFIGIEMDHKYFEIARKRVEEAENLHS